MGRRRLPVPAEVQALAQRLERYRKSPQRQRRLPESLWSQAAVLAKRYGAGRVQEALRLNYVDLKRRMTQRAPVSLPASFSPAFVELGRAALGTPQSGGATVELQDQTGRKLTVRLAASQEGDLLALVRALWSTLA